MKDEMNKRFRCRRKTMKVKNYLIVCTVLTSFWFTSTVFTDSQETFIRKVQDGGSLSQLIQTADGNYVYLNGSNITKLRSVSRPSISQTALSFDIPDYGYAGLTGLAQTENGLILVGYAQLNGYYGNVSAMMIKVASNGRIEWTRAFETSTNGNLDFHSAIPTSDRGFIVTGGTYPGDYHPVLIKFSSKGDVVWSKSFDTLSYLFKSAPTSDGGIILAADVLQNDGRPIGVNVIKIDGSGNIVWAVTLEMNQFSLHSLIPLTNRGYLLAGKGSDRNTLLLIRLNEDGAFHSKAAHSLNVPDFFIPALAETKDKGVAIGGAVINQSGSFYDGFVMKIDDHLKPIFQKRFGFREKQESIVSVRPKEDGSYLLFVSSSEATFIVGLNNDGSAPRCGFSHNLAASKVEFGRLTHEKLTITPNFFSPSYAGTVVVKAKHFNRPITNVCGD
ncbi:MAG TPA: hypothetical protein VLH08_08640 [Acidobacteriota bacterium]|nr:hypothetical protein [Acidobacteriota bacterium]